MMPFFVALLLVALSSFTTHSTCFGFQTSGRRHFVSTRLHERLYDNKEHNNKWPTTGDATFSRRQALTTAATTILLPDAARALVVPASSSELPSGLLESRVLENVLSPPPYGMEGSDVYYPSWFAGSWKVYSECTEVMAPCGIALFGGNRTYDAALADRGPAKALKYEARFLKNSDSTTTTIADREFNVKSIAKVAMGVNSVMDVPMATPNKFCCILLPQGSPSMLRVDLFVLNRRQEDVDETHFDCAEVVREIVSPVDSSIPTANRSPILKEVETTSLYTLQPNGGISCRQRSATFLLPSQQDPMALQMWQATRGRPIDVRYYDVTYTKKET